MTLPFSRLLSKQKGHTFGVISSDVVLLFCPLEDEWTMVFELSLIRSAIRCGCFCILGRAVANTGIRLLRLSIHKVHAFFPTSRNIKIYFPAILADRGLDFSAHFAAKSQALTSKIVATQESGNA